MIGYLDTSAIVPLLVAEPTSAACRRFWDDADDVVSCRLAYVEVAAALALANRTGRLDAAQHEQARTLLDQVWAELAVIDIDDRLVRAAANDAYECGLRGYDAVHCVAAEQVLEDDLVVASGDRQLLRAWRSRGVSTYDIAG